MEISTRKDLSRSWSWLPFWAAFAAALALRLVDLDARPFHHDEGVNAWILWKFLQGGEYRYNPGNYHGPFLYLFYWPAARLLGLGDAALRLPVALASSLMVPLLLPLRRRLGIAGVTGAAWLLAVSPSLVYYGRDLIHETYLVFFTLALVAAGSLYLETRRERHLLLTAACLGLLVAVKETAALTLATLAAAGLFTRRRTGPSGLPRPAALGRAVAVTVAVHVLFFTSFLTHLKGVPDSFRAFLFWTRRGAEGAGHEKPWYYFLRLLLEAEPLLVLCALAGGWLALRRRDGFGVFCALWAAGQLALYSAIPYKTPWLVLNVVLPAALAGGVFVRELAGRRAGPARTALVVAFAAGLAWSGWRAAEVSLVRYDEDGRLGIVYVQSHRQVRDLVAWVRQAVARAPAGESPLVRMYLPYSWPIPWYLRDLRVGAWKEVTDRPDGDVLIVEGRQDPELRRRLRGRYVRREYLLRPNTPVVVYVSERLASPSPPAPSPTRTSAPPGEGKKRENGGQPFSPSPGEGVGEAGEGARG